MGRDDFTRERSSTGANAVNLVRFRPPAGSDLVLLVSDWCAAGLITVETGQPFLRPPLIGKPSADAPRFEHLLRDRADVQLRSSWAAQPGAFDYSPAELPKRVERWKASRGSWHPGRHPVVCLDASLFRRIAGLTHRTIGDLFEAGPKAAKGWIAKGDQYWFDLGAWPWHCFPRGALPERWFEHDAAWLALDRAWRNHAASARLTRLERAESHRRQAHERMQLAEWLESETISEPPGGRFAG